MIVDLRDQGEGEVSGVEDVVDVVVLVWGFGEDGLERVQGWVDYGGSGVVVEEGVATVADRVLGGRG